MATKWGIVSAGKISSDFVHALKALPEEEHKVVAVAARSLDSAKAFCEKTGSGKPYGSYEELANDPEVEVVYIGTINPFHLPVASLMLKSGKHVLCEKPLCMNLAETKRLVDLAKEKELFLMEAVWSRYFPVYTEMKKRTDSGEIGDVVQIAATFGFPLEHVARSGIKELGGGATLDIGIYTIQFASFVMNGEMPEKILAAGHLNENGVDEVVSITLVYSGRRIATLCAGTRCLLANEAYIHGTKGSIKVETPFWCPVTMQSPSGKYESPLPNLGHSFNFPNSQGLMYEAAEVRRCLKEGLKESPVMTHNDSLLLATIMEEVRKQVGVRYPQDE